MAGWVIGDKVAGYTLTSGSGAYTTEATQPVGYQHINTFLANVGDWGIFRTEAGTDFEVAILTKTGSQTFARTEVIESTNADAAVSWPGGTTMTIALVVPADEFKGYDKYDFLCNGNGQVRQRAAGTVADDVYSLFDRWYALNQSNPTTPSNLTDVEDGFSNMMRWTQSNASAQRFGFAQIIEGQRCKKLRGKRVTFGGRLRYSNAAAVRFAILEWTGTEDSVTSDVVNDWTNATFTASNFFTNPGAIRAVGTITPAAATLTDFRLSAVLGSTFNNLIVMVWTEGTAAQNSTLDVSCQLKKGVIAHPLTFVPYDSDLVQCQRYFEKFGSIGYGKAASATNVEMEFAFRTPKRAISAAISMVSGLTSQIVEIASALRTVTAVASFSSDVGGTYSNAITVGAGGMSTGNMMSTYVGVDWLYADKEL